MSVHAHAARHEAFLVRQAARTRAQDPAAVHRVRVRRQADYRAAMVKRKGGPTRTRATAPTATRDGRPRAKRSPVRIECTVERCSWTGRARAWRPARRLRDEHAAERHRAKAA